ncbi:hypothetical protein RY45_05980 [Aeromonas hydrophila]|nr:hypothetical protein RY45_05980 [Aeromonas hydrophila]
MIIVTFYCLRPISPGIKLVLIACHRHGRPRRKLPPVISAMAQLVTPWAAIFPAPANGLLAISNLTKRWASQISFWDFKIHIYFTSLFFFTFFKERDNKNIY